MLKILYKILLGDYKMGDNNFIFNYGGKSITFFLPNKEDHIQKKIINSKNFYEIDLLEEIGRFPLEKGAFIDIGANIGNHSIYFASILNREVYAFEPTDEASNIFTKNIKLNGLEKKIHRFQVALGQKEQSANYILDELNTGATKLNIVEGGRVTIKPLDQFINIINAPIALIKIDVEGFELDVLKGAKKTIKEHKPLLIIETQEHMDFLKISKYVRKLGYKPIGSKGLTKTVFFISNAKWEKSVSMCTFLTRNDIEHSRRLIQGQSDKVSKTVNEIKDRIKTIETEIIQSIQEEQKYITQSLNEKISTLEQLQNQSASELLLNLQEDQKNISQSLNEKISTLEQLQNQSTSEILQSLQEDQKNISQSLNEKIQNIKLLLSHPSYISGEEINQRLKKVNSALITLIEVNKKLNKKIEVLFSSKERKAIQFLKKVIGLKNQSFAEYQKKLEQKFGDIDDLKVSTKSIIDFLHNDIYNINQIQKSIFNLIEDNIPEYNKNQKRKTNNRFSTLKNKTTANKIFVGIAAIPSREKALEKTIKSLINQTDKIGVYLNGWNNIPKYLLHPKIEIKKSQEHGDIGDAGKFFWIDGYEGYYFTCDDDIVYPDGYIKGIIDKIKTYKFKAVIGWHGSVIIKPFENYYTASSRRVFAFGSNRPEDTFVHILGTGTIGFHTSTIKVRLQDFKKPNMADVFFAQLGQIQKVPFIIMKHEAKKMISIDEVQEDSINKHGINNVDSKKNTKEYQNKLVKTINWKLHNSNKLKVLMIGRFETFTKGGIYKSNHLIKDTLTTLGHEIVAIDSQSDDFKIEKGIDAVIVYPGDPNRPDFSHAEEKMNLARAQGIPACINISYNTNSERSRKIVKKIQQYNLNKDLAPVFLMTFTDVALSDANLLDIQDYIVSMPKTVVGDNSQNDNFPEFSKREGIVLGDATKLMNNDITGGDITPWITACKRLLPHVKLYVFKQYGGKFAIPGVETVPYMQEGFLDWVAQRRLFVCLNTITTFEMTPAEAQIVGTPVVYRPMPQSLSEYVGRSGICVSSPEEFAQMCAWLYNDEFAWNSYSNLSLKNAQTNKLENLSIGLETSIRKIVFKASIRKT